MNFKVKVISNQLIEVRMKYNGKKKQSFLLISDVHFDNPKCKRDLFYRHLDQAKADGAGVLCFGDFFCLMQGKYDPRRSKKAVRPEHMSDNYLDLVFADSADHLAPWAKNFILFSDGNHETAILNKLEINPLDNLVDKLNYKYDGDVKRLPYQGFVNFVFEHESGGGIRSKMLYFHHGKFGGIVTKGVLGVGRHGLIAPQADYVVTGHTHDRWLVEQPRFKISPRNGKVSIPMQYHIKCGTYKEEFASGGGWAPERIVMPKSLGGWWLDLEIENKQLRESFRMTA